MSFAKEIEKISNRHHPSEVFDDFLQMAVCAFSLGKSESIYLEIAKKYDEKELKGFGMALGALIQEHETTNGENWNDFIGNYFELSGRSNSNTGQFFTPVSVCRLIAEMVGSNDGETVNDPSCGSSRNLITHAQLNPKNRFNYTYIGQDLDKRCCLMSVLNFVMFGMRGLIVHMNTISLEIYGGWRIYLPETCLGVQPLTADECRYFMLEQKTEPKINVEQLTLF